MNSRWTYIFAAVAAAGIHASAAFAQSASAGTDHGSHGLADGEVRKVDRDAQKLTIRHGAIPGIDMPPMTMVYRVKDPAMLGQVKQGDKIKFDAEKVGGQYVVTRIESAN